MNGISFKVVPHLILPGQQIVQILLDGKVIGAIYPDRARNGINIVSVHMADKELDPKFEGTVMEDAGHKHFPHIPSIAITFKLSSWSLTPDGRVFKENN